MDRLTFDGNFCDIAQCLEMRGGKHCPDGYCSQRRVWERLKEYEDTGVEPFTIKVAKETLACFDNIGIERGNKIVGAEEDGRLIVLPCKVGSNIYRLTEKGDICCWQIVTVEIYEEEIVIKDDSDNDVPLEDIGKTIFLTRNEAEAALAERMGKDDVAD